MRIAITERHTSVTAAVKEYATEKAGAERIVAYRDKYGPFKKVEDLLNVRGIGEKTFRKSGIDSSRCWFEASVTAFQ